MLPTDSYRFETQFKVARMILFRIKSFPLDCHGYKVMETVVLELRGVLWSLHSPIRRNLQAWEGQNMPGRNTENWRNYEYCAGCALVWLRTRIKTDKKLSYLLRTKVSVIQTLIITNVFIISTRLWNERIRRLCKPKWSEILKIRYLATWSACLYIPSDLIPAKFLIKMMFSQLSLSLWSNYSSHY